MLTTCSSHIVILAGACLTESLLVSGYDDLVLNEDSFRLPLLLTRLSRSVAFICPLFALKTFLPLLVSQLLFLSQLSLVLQGALHQLIIEKTIVEHFDRLSSKYSK